MNNKLISFLLVMVLGISVIQTLFIQKSNQELKKKSTDMEEILEKIQFQNALKKIPDWIPHHNEGIHLLVLLTDYSCIETLEWTIPNVNRLYENIPSNVSIYQVGGDNVVAPHFGAKFEPEIIRDFEGDQFMNPVMLLVDSNKIIHYMYEVDPFDQSDGELFIQHVESLLTSL